MSDWVKIRTYKRVHQAELRKEILTNNHIPAVVVNERDSLFLFGDIELYVMKEHEKKALALINDFKGLTKINSFIEAKPVESFKAYLQEKGIPTEIKRKEDNRFIKDNYELFIKDSELDKVLPYLKGKNPEGWKHVKTCRKVRQTKFYVDLLGEHSIKTITIKKKKTDFHLAEILIYVQADDFQKSHRLLEKPEGWEVVRHGEIYSDIEALEENLANNNIRALIKNEGERFSLLVKEEAAARADEILNLQAKWQSVGKFSTVMEAEYYKSILEEQGFSCVIVNEKDSSFMLGQIELMVEERSKEEALKLIKEVSSIE